MKDLIIKETGNSRTLKSSIGSISWEDARTLLQNGTFPVDLMGLNADGVAQMGTALNKANLLSDTTKAALELSQSDPTVNDALYALSQKTQPAELHVLASSGVIVTIAKGSNVLSATAGSDGWAILYPDEFGTWTITSGSLSKDIYINVIAEFWVVLPDIANLTWAQLSNISKKGIANQMFNIGDQKTFALDGVTYTAVIIGFDHDVVTNATAYGRSKAGITWQMLDCHKTTAQMNSSNVNDTSWENSAMRKATMTSLFNGLPADLKNSIVAVNKVTSAGNQSTALKTTSDNLFLLAEIEIFGSCTYSVPGEGSQYEWYKAGNTTIKKVNGSASVWWERSPYHDNNTSFCIVNSSGDAINGNSASNSRGVAFGFCI